MSGRLRHGATFFSRKCSLQHSALRDHEPSVVMMVRTFPKTTWVHVRCERNVAVTVLLHLEAQSQRGRPLVLERNDRTFPFEARCGIMGNKDRWRCLAMLGCGNVRDHTKPLKLSKPVRNG